MSLPSLPAVGIFCLGIIMGKLVHFFIERFKVFDPKTLASVVSVIVGGVVLQFLIVYLGADKSLMAWYPIGMVVGFALDRFGLLFHP